MTLVSNGGIGRACEACDTDNAWNRRFCRACGAKIVAACGGCDFGNAIADLFCGGCGADLATCADANRDEVQSQARPSSQPPKPPLSRKLDPEVQALARKLSDLNNDNVTRSGKPPPTPTNSGDAAADDFGQDQIDALFG
jgi:hypothetical protein